MIDWKPIAEMPEDRKDGREMLLWDGTSADVGVWASERWWEEGPGWNETTEGGPLNDITHYADINPPVGTIEWHVAWPPSYFGKPKS
jgi:hypothetical protein